MRKNNKLSPEQQIFHSIRSQDSQQQHKGYEIGLKEQPIEAQGKVEQKQKSQDQMNQNSRQKLKYLLGVDRSPENKNKKSDPGKVHVQPVTNFVDEDSLQFGASVYGQQMFFKQNIKQKIKQKQQSSDSDWNDTEQVIKSRTSGKINKQSEIKYPSINIKQKDLGYNYTNQKQKTSGDKYQKSNKKLDIGSKQKQKQDTMNFNHNLTNNRKRNEYLNKNQNMNQQQFNINISMIGARNTTKPAKISQKQIQNNKNMDFSHKQSQSQQSPRQSGKDQLHQGPQVFQSIYLNKGGVQLQIKDQTMYWTYDKKSMKVQPKTMEKFVQQFFKQQIMLPMVTTQQFSSQYICQYIKIYTEFLNQMFPEQFKTIFNRLKSKYTSGFWNQANTKLASNNNQGFGRYIYDEYIQKVIKGTSYSSKVEIVKNHKYKQMQILNMIQNIKKQQKENCMKQFEQKRKEILEQITYLQLLTSFEKSQKQCKNNSIQGIGQEVWKQNIKKLQQLRKKCIQLIQAKKSSSLSFKI